MEPIILALVILVAFVLYEARRISREHSEEPREATVVRCQTCKNTVSRRQVVKMHHCVYCFPEPKETPEPTTERIVKTAIIKEEN